MRGASAFGLGRGTERQRAFTKRKRRRRALGIQAFMEGLAARLESALPCSVSVTRKRQSLFSSAMRTTAIAATTEAGLLTFSIDHGRLKASRTSVVRGVAIGSTAMTVPAWLEELTARIRAAGDTTETARASLLAFLVG